METFLLSLLIVVLILVTDFIKGQKTHLGKLFIVSMPKMMSEPQPLFGTPCVLFLLSTPLSDVQVAIESHWYQEKSQPLRDSITLSPFVVYDYTLNRTFNHQEDFGFVHSFKLEANKAFSLVVTMINSVSSIATMMAVPVDSWGKVYFAVTLGHRISITVVTHRGPNLIFVRSSNKNFHLVINSQVPGTHQMYTISIAKNQAFVFATCNSSSDIGTLTGTKFSGQLEFGLISGNCNASTLSHVCNKTSILKYGFGDIAAEMLLPYETYGREFLTFDVVKPSSGSFYFLVAGEDDTTVVITGGSTTKSDSFHLPTSGSWVERIIGISRVTSSKGIMVVRVRRSPCLVSSQRSNEKLYYPGEVGAPSLSLIVPTALFYFTYIFRMPRFFSNFYYIIVIVKKHFANYLTLKGDPLKISRWTHFPEGQSWMFGQVEVKPNIDYTLTSERSFIGCYVYGHGQYYAYMYPAGYITSQINTKCFKDLDRMKEGDLVDNDCDGSIDEEYLNEKDDDGDSLIDEDLNTFLDSESTNFSNISSVTAVTERGPGVYTEFRNPIYDLDNLEDNPINPEVIVPALAPREALDVTLTSEGFEPWSDWVCTRDCSKTSMIRIRQCQHNKLCDGPLSETRPGTCYFNTKCPNDCPSFRWGTNCIMSCENCVNDCDKFTGLCETCKAGFTDPATGCRKSCPDYTYGIDCKLSCIDVCSDDCLSRVTGQCYDVFEPWHEWHCSRSCLDTKAYRERVCDRSKPGSVCKGNKSESKESNCYVEITCPNNCDPFKWGDDCVYSCEHCEHDCEKFTGVCQQCKPGYKNPKKGCLEECGRFFYGYNCEGDCTLKCGADCAEKVYGRCSSGYEQYALLLVLLLLFAPCLFILFRKKRDHNVTKARRSSYMGKIGLMSRRVSHTPERASKAPTRSVKMKRSRRTMKDVRSWSSYDDDDDDEDDDDD